MERASQREKEKRMSLVLIFKDFFLFSQPMRWCGLYQEQYNSSAHRQWYYENGKTGKRGEESGTYFDPRTRDTKSRKSHVRNTLHKVSCNAIPLSMSGNAKESIGYEVKIVLKVKITSHRVEKINGYPRTTGDSILSTFHLSWTRVEVDEDGNYFLSRTCVYLRLPQRRGRACQSRRNSNERRRQGKKTAKGYTWG